MRGTGRWLAAAANGWSVLLEVSCAVTEGGRACTWSCVCQLIEGCCVPIVLTSRWAWLVAATVTAGACADPFASCHPGQGGSQVSERRARRWGPRSTALELLIRRVPLCQLLALWIWVCRPLAVRHGVFSMSSSMSSARGHASAAQRPRGLWDPRVKDGEEHERRRRGPT